MDIRNEIITAYHNFNTYLESLDLEKWKPLYSRQEWTELQKEIHSLKARSLPYEIGEIVKKMKVEEYPELLGVHHFPAIRTIDFLSEEKKIELDNFLANHRVGNYVLSLWRVVPEGVSEEQLKSWLIENGIFEEVKALQCPCRESNLTSCMTATEKQAFENWLVDFKEKDDYDAYEKISEWLPDYCEECEWNVAIENLDLDNLHWEKHLRMKAERDTTLDNV